MSRISAIVVAAGKGKRFGSSKQFVLLKGKPVLDHCLERLEAHKDISEIILVLRNKKFERRYLEHYSKISAIANGGRRRQNSVISGFNRIDQKNTDIVLVHDGVRPLITGDLLDRIIDAAQKKGAAAPVIPVEDTLKLVKGKDVLRTVARTGLFRVQTPQGFSYEVLKKALDKAVEDDYYGTDEAVLVERTGIEICAVEGDPRNIKVTTPDDIIIAEAFLED